MSTQILTAESLGGGRSEAAAALLGRAFADDPLMKFLVAERSSVPDGARRFFEASLKLGLRQGEVHVLADMEGAAVWLRPDHTKVGLSAMLGSGMLAATLGMGVKSLGRFASIYRYVEPLEELTVPGPHWLLMLLGIDPPHQGKGLGGRLLAPVLERADADGVACYLDSGNERNLAFYHRHGFEVAREVQIPKGPKVWAMVREPIPAQM